MRRYLPFLLVLFVIAAVLRVDFYFSVAYLFFLLLVLGRWWTRRSLDHTHFERQFVDRAFAGDEVPVTVRIRNTSRLPVPWLEIHESLPIELATPPFRQEVLSLGPRQATSFTYTLQCRRRGVYHLGPLKSQTGDLLGIDPPRAGQQAPAPLIVYPRVIPLPRLGLPTRSPQVALPARMPLFEDPARVTGVRDYQRGDSPRRIHWTATASTGRLLVKQYQPAVARETLLALDFSFDGYERRGRAEACELAVVVAASLANHIVVRERLPAGLAADGADPLLDSRRSRRVYLPPRPGRGHLMNVLEALARLQLANGSPLAEVIRREQPRLAWGTTVVAISGRATDDLVGALAALRYAGFAVTLILVQAARAEQAIRRAAVLGVAVREVWEETDLETWR